MQGSLDKFVDELSFGVIRSHEHVLVSFGVVFCGFEIGRRMLFDLWEALPLLFYEYEGGQPTTKGVSLTASSSRIFHGRLKPASLVAMLIGSRRSVGGNCEGLNPLGEYMRNFQTVQKWR